MTYNVKEWSEYPNRWNTWGKQKYADISFFQNREKLWFVLLFFKFVFAVDALDLLLLMLDMTNSIPLRMVHAGRPEEQPKEEWQDGQALHGLQTKPPS